MSIEVIGGKNWGGQLVEGSVLESVWHPMPQNRPVTPPAWRVNPGGGWYPQWFHPPHDQLFHTGLMAELWGQWRETCLPITFSIGWGQGREDGWEKALCDCPHCSPASLCKTGKSAGLPHVIFGRKCGYAIPHSLMLTCFNCVKSYLTSFSKSLS